MKGLIFDIEADGLLEACGDKSPALTRIHCIAYGESTDDVGGGGSPITSVNGRSNIMAFLTHLQDAPIIIGHNIQDYDIRALNKVYGFVPKGLVRDTLLISRLIWPEIKVSDFQMSVAHPEFPKKYIGQHGLRAWGHRLGCHKGDFMGPWDAWSPEMEAYCQQDVQVTRCLAALITSKYYSEEAIELEHEFHRCIIAQESHGFPFNEQAAHTLYAELASRRAELGRALQGYFPPWEEHEVFLPKVNNISRGYVKDMPFTKVKTVTFNPRSGEHMAQRLAVQRQWKPMVFTEKTGRPTMDGDILEELAKMWPECALLAEHVDINKIIGMLAEGKQAWLKLVRGGRIHGGVITNGTVTGRCAHVRPNLGQIPRRSALGLKCRELFIARPGYTLVGVDAAGLELRMLAHFLAKYDGGVYTKIVTTGDVHTENQKAVGLATRDDAKTFIYAFIYGAGDAKIGSIMGASAAEGKKLKARFTKNTQGFRELQRAVEEAVRQRKYLIGLDKRLLGIRSIHSALNTLLQSAGALVMKMATVLLHRALYHERGYSSDIIQMVAHVHDEMQLLVKEGYQEEVGVLAVECIKRAGEHFRLRCPLDGAWRAGGSWKETH